MKRLNETQQVTIKADENSRLPILIVEIERELRNYRKAYVKDLLKRKRVAKTGPRNRYVVHPGHE